MCGAPANMTDSLHFHFKKKNKKQDNQTAFAGSKKKSFKSGRNAMLQYYPILIF